MARLVRVGVMAVVLVCVAGSAAAALSAQARERHPSAEAPVSVRAMAQDIGCAATFTAVPMHAPAREAGKCVSTGGVQVQFRVFENQDQARGWGAAMGERDTGAVDPSIYGSTWVVRVIDTDRLTANRIFAALPQG